VPQPASDAPLHTDALIIGAGPVALFQAFELGLLDLRCHLVDALPHVGGQCAELYPHKPIYDIPGLPVVTGQELVDRLLAQIAPFAPPMHLGQLVSQVQRQDDGLWQVHTQTGQAFVTPAVILAAGAGAFLPRTLPITGLDALQPGQAGHHLPQADTLAGQPVLILGDEDLALQAAIDLAEAGNCQRVTLMHRRDQFRASASVLAAFQALRQAGRIQFVAGQPLAVQESDGLLQALSYVDTAGQTQTLACSRLLMLLGLSPKLGPIADWGLALERRQVLVNTATYETALPGLYAVGDINTYPGKRKLLLCGFHEATLAAFAVAAQRDGGKPPLLQYTTTSPKLHQLLGVAGHTRSAG